MIRPARNEHFDAETRRRRPSVLVRPKGQFDLRLSLEAAQSFLPVSGPPLSTLRATVPLERGAALVEVRQSLSVNGPLHAASTPAMARDRLRAIVRWLVSADLDLAPFYELATSHPIMGAVVRSLPGLKPLRPATLFEMAVIAITEQQLSLAAAFHIRSRLVRRFGVPLGDLWVFPSPQRLAAARLPGLRACGLSQRKAEYVKALAKRIAAGALNFEALEHESDQRIRDVLMSNPGFGEWSVEYILIRGFGRPDCLPSGDVGLRRVVGQYLAGGRRLMASELEEVLQPFAPFRGLAAYYFAVHWRVRRPMSLPARSLPIR